MMYDKGKEKGQLTRLIKDTEFNDIFKNLIIGNKNISKEDKEYIITVEKHNIRIKK